MGVPVDALPNGTLMAHCIGTANPFTLSRVLQNAVFLNSMLKIIHSARLVIFSGKEETIPLDLFKHPLINAGGFRTRCRTTIPGHKAGFPVAAWLHGIIRLN